MAKLAIILNFMAKTLCPEGMYPKNSYTFPLFTLFFSRDFAPIIEIFIFGVTMNFLWAHKLFALSHLTFFPGPETEFDDLQNILGW